MIEQRFHGRTAVLIANGPSLTEAQVEACREPHAKDLISVFGVNDAYRICDFLDLLYAADTKWTDYHDERIPKALECWGAVDNDNKKSPKWTEVPVKAGKCLSDDRSQLVSGNHSGYQLINLAYLFGCDTVILLGYDCKLGGEHWFGQHPTERMQVKSNYRRWLENYRSIDNSKLNIINATPGSAIDCFPRANIHELLEGLHHAYAS